ncbi:serine-rich adhesin for platelets [Anopheles gambiae]|uniref:serine-rich adhesin for platelets n=1 Tax=Anopheles gambiae TaxID=7165 RepID=UPI002AC9CAEE|nr:serine-rich adhesin for platelets [Anopheles gambiae]XP_061511709.1 serine-rich adhesin for platelets [Anopheles gambiae]XP_061511710.1 serine-rich adhesin for platelets [Anopheles gambiae]XP_061511711.1 serine-rich adhesin for platelets [Anopheles gambiae]
MSAPEDSTATAQPAPDHHHHHLHHHHHHQQNVVSAAATASASSASSATVVAGATAVPAPTNTGPPTAATATLSVPAAPAADIVTGSGASASTTLPAIKAGGNSSHATILTTTSHSKEVDGGTATNPAAQDGSNAAPGVVGPSDATDATSSCDSDKAPAAAAAAAAAIVTSSPPGADEGAAAATSDSFASVEVGSTGGTSTPLAAASPASLTGGDIGGPKPLPLSGCGSLMVAGSSSIVVPNGEGGDSNPNVPVLSGTATTIPLRGRDVTDKHAVDYHYRMLEEELQAVKESEAKIKQQYSESQRRERILARRVAVQEQEMRDFSKQIAELKSAQAPGPAALRSALLDPAVNILFQKLKAELQATKAKLEETQNELSAWKFTPDSNTGKRLMAKCRLLYQENEELGKMTSNGRLAKLESELALQKSYNEEVKKSQLELDDFLQELDEDVEGMQGTIVFLQQELKQTKDARNEIEKEVIQLRAYIAANLGPFSGSGNNPTSGSTPTDERSSSMMMMMDVQDSNSNSNSHGHDAYHHPDGGGPDSIGGRGVRLGELGGGVTPIYLVNGGGGGGGAGAGGASSSSGGTVIDAASRLVNKSSSSGDDQDMMVYSNRTHCGGVVTNSNELRTTPTTGAAGALPAAASVATAAAVSSLSALLPGSVPDPGIGGGGSSANSNTATVNGGAAGSGGEPLVNELHDSLVPSEGTRTSGGNTDSNSGGNVADTGNSVNSTNSSSSSLAVAKQPHQPQQQQQQPQQPQQQRTNNNVGRNGGRTTVAARKRNYNETEVDSAEQTDGGSGGGVVSSSDAYRSESGVDGVLVMDVGVAESSATSGVANGKLAIADGSLLPEQQQDVESSNSNKRMTRSGKGKAAAATTTTISSSSTSSSSSSSSSSAASNVLMTSAAKKLRRGSIAPDDEVDPLADPQPSPQQQPQQPISSANGSN